MFRFARVARVLVFSLLPMAAVGCAQSAVPTPSQSASSVSQTATSASQPTLSASESWLSSNSVDAGWVRGVGRGDGLVLVFETPSQLYDTSMGMGWPARFVLFNDGDRDRTWQNVEYGVTVAGSQRGGPMTIGFYRGPAVTSSPLVLRSRESTTHEVNWRPHFQNWEGSLRVLPSVRQNEDQSSVIADVPTLTINIRAGR